MVRIFLALSGLFGCTSVILGSYASHGLKSILSAEQILTFKLGVQYQMYHAIALLAVAILCHLFTSRLIKTAGWLFVIGILFFCGTLYSITYFGLPNYKTAPIGGFAFIFGWLLLLIAAWKLPTKQPRME